MPPKRISQSEYMGKVIEQSELQYSGGTPVNLATVNPVDGYVVEITPFYEGQNSLVPFDLYYIAVQFSSAEARNMDLTLVFSDGVEHPGDSQTNNTDAFYKFIAPPKVGAGGLIRLHISKTAAECFVSWKGLIKFD